GTDSGSSQLLSFQPITLPRSAKAELDSSRWLLSPHSTMRFAAPSRSLLPPSPRLIRCWSVSPSVVPQWTHSSPSRWNTSRRVLARTVTAPPPPPPGSAPAVTCSATGTRGAPTATPSKAGPHTGAQHQPHHALHAPPSSPTPPHNASHPERPHAP